MLELGYEPECNRGDPSMTSPPSRDELASRARSRERFQRHLTEWKEQSRYLSNSAQIAILKPYQHIIGMGLPAVPLILGELQREPDQWF